MTELYELCTKFDVCSAPKCPLDSLYYKRTMKYPGEEVCTVRKSIRLRIVKENPDYKIPFKGYTAREWGWFEKFHT